MRFALRISGCARLSRRALATVPDVRSLWTGLADTHVFGMLSADQAEHLGKPSTRERSPWRLRTVHLSSELPFAQIYALDLPLEPDNVATTTHFVQKKRILICDKAFSPGGLPGAYRCAAIGFDRKLS